MSYTAVGQKAGGDGAVLEIFNLPRPVPGPKDLLIRVRGVSSNPTDYKHREGYAGSQGSMGGDQPLVVGYDGAGVVEEVGSEVAGFKVGDEVWWAGDRLRPGSNAELELVDYRIASLKPKKLAFDDAAALPLCAITAWEGIVEKMGIPVNVNGPVNPKSLLIVNGAGGVGSIAIQIARRVLNLQHVVATASRPESVAWCEKMGATAVINHKEPLGPQLEKLGIKSIDYAFLCFDPDLFMDELAGLISPMGHINCILPVMKLSPAASGGLFWKAASLSYTLMYTKAMFQTNMESQGAILAACAKYVDEGLLNTTATDRMDFTLANLRLAQDKIKGMGVIGKIVLKLEGAIKEN